MRLMPVLPATLYRAGKEGITAYCVELMTFIQEHMEYAKLMPAIVAETLGKALGSCNKALVAALFIGAGKAFKVGAAAMGYPDDDLTQPEALFEDALKHPGGMTIARFQCDNFRMLKTEDKKLALYIPELDEQMKNATIENELKALEPDRDYPMFLHAGLHHETVINTALRDPAWNKGRDADNMFISAADAARLGVTDGDRVRVTTRASSLELPVEISPRAAENFVYIRHGRGMIYDGVQHGVNVNQLVPADNCDELFKPIHRRVPCRVEKI